MKKTLLSLAALTLALGASLSWAADEPSASQAAPGVTGNAPAPNAAATGSPETAQTPPANWTSLKGTVQAVDPAAKTVQIKEETGNLVQVPVDKQVSIQKDGKQIKLSQVQAGDIIKLAKRNTAAQEQEKTKAY